MSPLRSSLLRCLPSIALLGVALASSGCEPVMETYMAEELGVRTQRFDVKDPIHCIAYLRGGDTLTRLTFALVETPPGTPTFEQSYYPRPTTAELKDPIQFDFQMQVIAPDGTASAQGPWVPGNYRMRVTLDDADTDVVIQEEELPFFVVAP
jgi:hypothetical protein